jgi:hypothetical protein
MPIAGNVPIRGQAQVAVSAPYTNVVTGELAGVTSATQLPDVSCKLARLKAGASNVGGVYVGAAGVTKPDGATDATTGFELRPGEETGWIPVDNLNRLYRICDNAGDDLLYLALA